jgi:hypothetical protein
MKNKLIVTFIAGLLSVVSLVRAQIEFVPYYNYQFIEGVSVSPDGDMGFLINLSNDIGAIVKPSERHAFIGFYSVKYQGPGLKKQEGREFSERYLDHLFVGRHHFTLANGMVLKSQFDVLMERRRAGTNETWESGLYNFNRYGGNISFSKTLGQFEVTPTVKYHYITFPNYTDMLAEIRSGADASVSEGKQNHHIFDIGAKAVTGCNTLSMNISQQLFTKQEIAVDKVQSNGSYYSSEKQKDMTVTLGASRDQVWTKRTSVYPQVTFVFKDSNQNYQHFTEMTSTAPVSFHADYNDYYDVGVAMPISLALTPKWSLIFTPEISYKSYLKRKTRDSEGNFLSDVQSRLLGIYTVGFKKQIGESSSSLLFLTYQKQQSNMEFERYVTYNYGAFSTGFKFQMEY